MAPTLSCQEPDSLPMLQEDNVCGMQDIREAFGVEPAPFSEGLKRFIRKAGG